MHMYIDTCTQNIHTQWIRIRNWEHTHTHTHTHTQPTRNNLNIRLLLLPPFPTLPPTPTKQFAKNSNQCKTQHCRLVRGRLPKQKPKKKLSLKFRRIVPEIVPTFCCWYWYFFYTWHYWHYCKRVPTLTQNVLVVYSSVRVFDSWAVVTLIEGLLAQLLEGSRN